MMLCSSLVRKFGGARITQFGCLVKAGVGKTCAVVGRMWCGKVEKESGEDIF